MRPVFDPKWIFILCASTVVLSVLLIFGFIFVTAWPVIQLSGLYLILGNTWNYSTHQYGMFIMIVSTVLVATIALIIATPLSLFTAIYLTEYAPKSLAKVLRYCIELLVGIPSVVYGIFGFYILNAFFRDTVKPVIGSTLGFIPFFRNLDPNGGEGFLLVGFVLSVMVLPTIVALTQESLKAVPESYREASLALGATKWQTIRSVVIPSGIAGIITAFILAAMRAMGETMAVIMLIGGKLQFPQSILDSGTVMSAKIVSDAGYWLAFPESRSALFAIAAVLFTMEVLMVASIRLISKRIPRG